MMFRTSNIPGQDAGHSRLSMLQMLYAVEPELETIAKQASAQKQRPIEDKYRVYVAAKRAAWKLVGWGARDPRLRSSEAWECYFRYILEELKL